MDELSGLRPYVHDWINRDGGYAWGRLIGLFQGIPELRALWPMSAVKESGSVLDLSGQGRGLVNNGSIPRGIFGGLTAYSQFDGISQYYSRGDEIGLDLAGPYTVGGWFWVNHWIAGYHQGLITKSNGSTVTSNYWLSVYGDGKAWAWVGDGTTAKAVTASEMMAPMRWHFVAARYLPGEELAVMQDGVVTSAHNGVVTSAYNNASSLNIGGYGDGYGYLSGRAGVCFVSAAGLGDGLLQELFELSRAAYGV